MGHNRIPTLPRSAKWMDVVEALGAGLGADAIASLTFRAVGRDLDSAANDAVYREAVHLLAAIPLAARAADFVHALRDLGVDAGDRPELADVIFAVGDRLDFIAAASDVANDIGELSRRALTAALSKGIGDKAPGLIASTADDVRIAARQCSDPSEFAALARSFFTRFLGEVLSSHLDRVMALHVGEGERFRHVGDRAVFEAEMATFAHETTAIVHEFARGWYGKNAYGPNGLTERTAAGFGAFALTKIHSELQRGEADLG